MNSTPGSGRRFGMRAVVFALLAVVAAAVVLAAGTPPAGVASPWGRLYRRAGDTYVHIFYLAASIRPRTLRDDPILVQSLEYYQLSAAIDPNGRLTRLSRALVLASLDRTKEAEALLRQALKEEQIEPGRRQVRAVLLALGSPSPSQAQVEAAQRAVGDLVPGPAFLARLHVINGDVAGAQRALAEGRARADSLVAPLIGAGLVCALILLAGPVGLVGYALTWRRRRPPVPPPARWGLREGFEALILFFIIQIAVSPALLLAPQLMESQPFVLFIPSVLGALGAIAWVRAMSPEARNLGWRTKTSWRQFLIGVSAAGLLIPLVIGLGRLVEALTRQPPAEHPLVPLFTEAVTWPARVSLLLGAAAVVPVVEETVFRGILYGAMRRRWSVPAAAAASAVIFAVGHPHTGIVGLLPYVAIGVALAWLYERTGSLVAPAAAHAAFNLFFVTALLVLFR